MKDYLAMLRPKPEDALQYGVKGMRWGHRRTSSQLKAAAAKRAESAPKHDVTKAPSSGVETSATRYARLKIQAKEGGASSMSDEDLKFFNARTEALAKVNKMNEVNPGWLSKTSKKIMQATAEQQMQAISSALANKYISGPIVDSIGKHVTKEAAAKAAKKAAEQAKS